MMVDAGSTTRQRRHVYYSGHVQGVGFRVTARQIAQVHAITGFVRNLPDGRVELVAEGDPVELNRFLTALADRMADQIRHTTIDAGPSSNEFAGFEIRP